MAIRVVCESTELAVECLQIAQSVEVEVAPMVAGDDWLAAATTHPAEQMIAVALQAPPELSALVTLSETAASQRQRALVSIAAPDPYAQLVRGAGSDLGVCMACEVEVLVAILALWSGGAYHAWQASIRGLPSVDRVRLKPSLAGTSRMAGQFVRCDATHIAWREQPESPPQPLGRPRDVADALLAMRACEGAGARVQTSVDVDRQQVLDVLFGPPRALSDPASKAALAPYGLPMPEEELCASASRAAAEAARLGFPVRIALASPDLRIWDHPELALDMLGSAAAVRDAYRQLTAMAQTAGRAAGEEEPRLLGVTVTAENRSHALLGVRCRALGAVRVAAEIWLADEGGQASHDRVLTILPVPEDQFERIVRRFAGSDHLLGGEPALRAERLGNIADLLLRTTAFALDFRDHVRSIELRPVAVLLDGQVEVREACVTVSDAFARSLTNAS
ncbi:MAG: acetate--CoA ligase family protein [Myxococcales bacterium]|nr:acetate--CoA ligase family protein [Myxococcales bacterium]MDD9972135.1 acetate--CoA ligase family protein [Myxococcales bacterium]